MRKKTGIVLLVLILLFTAAYLYVYRGHRDIAKEEESYVIDAKTLFSDYQKNEVEADKKYLNKTIVVNGHLSSVNYETQSLVLEEKLFAVFSDKIEGNMKLGLNLKIKGRLIGYDSLLEQIKMDQCIILN